MYQSGSPSDGPTFSLEKAMEAMKLFNKKGKKGVKVFTDDDYKSLDTSEYQRKHYAMVKQKKA